MYSVSIRRIHC